MRIGPSLDYGTQWIYRVSGLPLEITAEYGNWRQVRDSDGVSGWMHRALLSSKRTAHHRPMDRRERSDPRRTDDVGDNAGVARCTGPAFHRQLRRPLVQGRGNRPPSRRFRQADEPLGRLSQRDHQVTTPRGTACCEVILIKARSLGEVADPVGEIARLQAAARMKLPSPANSSTDFSRASIS
jgi:hypothetical protein